VFAKPGYERAGDRIVFVGGAAAHRAFRTTLNLGLSSVCRVSLLALTFT
jgi:hypothetical protein